ncbi:hypothetical protein QBC39DRAFT_270728, partial [Podospora conica]
PARTTELLKVRFQNTSYGSLRNLFIQFKIVYLVILYYKGFQTSGQSKVIYRYLPRALGKSIIRYLSIVLPFA